MWKFFLTLHFVVAQVSSEFLETPLWGGVANLDAAVFGVNLLDQAIFVNCQLKFCAVGLNEEVKSGQERVRLQIGRSSKHTRQMTTNR